jgi:hypothetical protein
VYWKPVWHKLNIALNRDGSCDLPGGFPARHTSHALFQNWANIIDPDVFLTPYSLWGHLPGSIYQPCSLVF